MGRSPYLPATISYFLITVLVSIALESGIERIQGMITTKTLTLTSLFVTIAFVVTLLRFYFGNLILMVTVERMMTEKPIGTMSIREKKLPHESFWFFNMFFIFVEMFFFSLMSGFICDMHSYFVLFTLIVLVIDVLWFVTYATLFSHRLLLTLMRNWGLLNVATVFALVTVVLIFGYSDAATIFLLSIMLIISAIADFLLTLRYYLFHESR